MTDSEINQILEEIHSKRSQYAESGYGQDRVSSGLVDDLAKYECAGLTARRSRSDKEKGIDRDPVVLKSGKGAFLWDADGLPYVDMGACFAVAAYGHANPELVEALEEQAHDLMHGMGDVFPTDTKIHFLKALATLAPGNLSGALLSQSGAEAVEIALKMAQIATGKSRFISFESSYHGVSYGALSVTGHQNDFKKPFSDRICQRTTFVPYPNCKRCAFSRKPSECGFACISHIDRILSLPSGGADDVAAVIAEPIQGRGGDVVPPKGWLKALRELCTKHGILLILDEIYTGFGRTGKLFACNHEEVVPDIMCLGKAMTGGFPLSATIATPEVLNHWPLNTSEAIHTSTFLGNPMGCAVALQAMKIQQRDNLPEQARQKGTYILDEFRRMQAEYPDFIFDARGAGLMAALEMARPDGTPLTEIALRIVDEMRSRGFLLLPSGPWGHVVSISPPLIIPMQCLRAFIKALDEVLALIRESQTAHE